MRFPEPDGTWLKGLLSPHTAPWNFKNQCYLPESLLRPSALARQPHPRSTFGLINGTCHKAGSGKGGWQPWCDIPAAQAGPVCPAVLEVPTGSKALESGEGPWEAPSQRRDPHSHRRSKGLWITTSTPLPSVQVGKLRPCKGSGSPKSPGALASKDQGPRAPDGDRSGLSSQGPWRDLGVPGKGPEITCDSSSLSHFHALFHSPALSHFHSRSQSSFSLPLPPSSGLAGWG